MEARIAIPVERIGDHIYVRPQVGDDQGLVMLLDTGAPTTLFDAGCAEELAGHGLAEIEKLEKASTLDGIGGEGSVECSRQATVELKFQRHGSGTVEATMPVPGAVIDLRGTCAPLYAEVKGRGRLLGVLGLDFMGALGMRICLDSMECVAVLGEIQEGSDGVAGD